MTKLDINNMVYTYALRLGDDALVLGHRLSEWCSKAPFLEEDLALANTSLDYIGRARNFLTYAAKLNGSDTTEDNLAYQRDCRDYTNLLIHELPRGDFAFTMVRQYLVDEFESLFLAALMKSTDSDLSGIASKSEKETRYHLRRSREWMLRLGCGTDESKTRLQEALDELIGYTTELFDMDDLEQQLSDVGVAVDRQALYADWFVSVSETFLAAEVTLPPANWAVKGGRTGFHTEHLGHLLSDLQYVQRAYPGCSW